MWGLLIIGFLIELYELVASIWPYLVAGVAIVALWCFVAVPLLEYRAREARDRLRHARARQEISAIEHAATRAMFDTAQAGEVIEGTAVEIDRMHGRLP
jgi:hypothetical protein